MRRVNITANIKATNPPKEVMTKFGPGRVAECTLSDGDREITLILWNEHIELAQLGRKLEIENGYVDSFRGELQLNVGRYGKIEVVA